MLAENMVEAREMMRIRRSRMKLMELSQDILKVVEAYYSDNKIKKMRTVMEMLVKHDIMRDDIIGGFDYTEEDDDPGETAIRDLQYILMMQHIYLCRLKQEQEYESLRDIFYIYQTN